jgi:hypothetical protein
MDIRTKDPEIETLCRRIENGNIDLQPDFQRDQVWNTRKKQGLIDTIIRGWEFPPVFLIAPNGSRKNRYEVLDGQQRLNAIYEFYSNGFTIDGKIAPINSFVEELDGKLYSELPAQVRDEFLIRSVRVHYISNYRKDEPYELFFRLNQGVNLTPAERRNTLYGEVRAQVSELFLHMQDVGLDIRKIGFNNNRLSYQDVLSRFLFVVENPSFKGKIKDADLQLFFRSENGASRKSMDAVKTAIDRLSNSIEGKVKLNKATLLTWLCFTFINEVNRKFIERVEFERQEVRKREKSFRLQDFISYLYFEKSSTSVNDSTPVRLRLLCLYLLAEIFDQPLIDSEMREKSHLIFQQVNQNEVRSEDALVQLMHEFDWGYL